MQIRRFSVLLLLCVLLSIQPAFAFTSYDGEGDMEILQQIDDDVYAAGGNLQINSDINGDLVVTGGTITINGDISGDLIAAGGTIAIRGNIADDVRIAAGKLTISGNIGDDVIAGCGQIILEENATIGGDLTAGTDKAYLYGDVAGDVSGNFGNIILGGNVAGEVDVDTNKIQTLPDATIQGETITSTDRYAGQTESDENGYGFMDTVFWLLRYIMLLLTGWIILYLATNSIEDMTFHLTDKPIHKTIAGLLSLLGIVMGSIALTVTVIGIPLALLLFLILVFMLYCARIIAGLWLGKKLFELLGRTTTRWREMAVGIFILLLLGSIPYIGWIVYMVATLLSTGAIYYLLKEKVRHRPA
ncbi:bactofilin family protein [Methanohalophilus mahii]|uniref:DUF8173 domain-containing protein n=1 Tax=Methanohalophilus mahii (strain ATCC 35705 / DSM 5219 / SLP) TaxID=547558 RepID=D5E7G4_METMS|nr:hypothetical protein [Methanohalophilus mahii]ADE37102.1 hypothetical protein Mmah_1606 [Methanohalophilus mahii DSM 5219]